MQSQCEKCARKRSSCPALGNGNSRIKYRKGALAEDTRKREKSCEIHFVARQA